MQRHSPKACNKIEYQKPPGAPNTLQYRAKHPERKHVEKNMHKPAVHKHVGHYLHRFEKRACRIKKAEHLHHFFTNNGGYNEYYNVGKNKIKSYASRIKIKHGGRKFKRRLGI